MNTDFRISILGESVSTIWTHNYEPKSIVLLGQFEKETKECILIAHFEIKNNFLQEIYNCLIDNPKTTNVYVLTHTSYSDFLKHLHFENKDRYILRDAMMG